MARKFHDLAAQMPEERQARIAAETPRLISEMPLQGTINLNEVSRFGRLHNHG
jgi:hypothetical protein